MPITDTKRIFAKAILLQDIEPFIEHLANKKPQANQIIEALKGCWFLLEKHLGTEVEAFYHFYRKTEAYTSYGHYWRIKSLLEKYGVTDLLRLEHQTYDRFINLNFTMLTLFSDVALFRLLRSQMRLFASHPDKAGLSEASFNILIDQYENKQVEPLKEIVRSCYELDLTSYLRAYIATMTSMAEIDSIKRFLKTLTPAEVAVALDWLVDNPRPYRFIDRDLLFAQVEAVRNSTNKEDKQKYNLATLAQIIKNDPNISISVEHLGLLVRYGYSAFIQFDNAERVVSVRELDKLRMTLPTEAITHWLLYQELSMKSFMRLADKINDNEWADTLTIANRLGIERLRLQPMPMSAGAEFKFDLGEYKDSLHIIFSYLERKDLNTLNMISHEFNAYVAFYLSNGSMNADYLKLQDFPERIADELRISYSLHPLLIYLPYCLITSFLFVSLLIYDVISAIEDSTEATIITAQNEILAMLIYRVFSVLSPLLALLEFSPLKPVTRILSVYQNRQIKDNLEIYKDYIHHMLSALSFIQASLTLLEIVLPSSQTKLVNDLVRLQTTFAEPFHSGSSSRLDFNTQRIITEALCTSLFKNMTREQFNKLYSDLDFRKEMKMQLYRESTMSRLSNKSSTIEIEAVDEPAQQTISASRNQQRFFPLMSAPSQTSNLLTVSDDDTRIELTDSEEDDVERPLIKKS